MARSCHIIGAPNVLANQQTKLFSAMLNHQGLLARRKISILIEHVICGKKSLVVVLRDKPATAHRQTIRKPPTRAINAAHRANDQGHVGKFLCDLIHGALARIGHALAQNQIARRISKQRHLTCEQQASALLVGVFRCGNDQLLVAHNVTNCGIHLCKRDTHAVDATNSSGFLGRTISSRFRPTRIHR